MLRPAVERGAAPQMELLQLERSIAELEAEMNGLQLALPRARSAVSEATERIEEVGQLPVRRAENWQNGLLK